MEYQLELAGGKKVPLYFGTWSLMRFCEQNGNLSFSGMQELFSKDISYKHVVSLLLCGAEHYAKKNKQPFDFTDIDASDWLDEIGGLMSDKGFELLSVIAKAINPQYQGIEVKKGSEEKKMSVGSTSELTASERA